MSILARNMKTIRKELHCTQGALAEILDIGFRTYVRYEAGERDAPVTILIKLARLANVSLQHLLTQELPKHQIVPHLTDRLDVPTPEIRTCNLRQGSVVFKKPAKEGLITLDSQERRLLSSFRKLPQSGKNSFLKEMTRNYKLSASSKPGSSSKSNRKDARVQIENTTILAQAAAIIPAPGIGKGKPGRRKLDRKSLKEKIDKLKTVTRSAPRTTVR